MPVTLVVKTPSLKLSDLTYCCEASSTVLELKTFLQDQYPSKPKPEEQRLIYQGRLLHDGEILHNFLRDIEVEERHTLHLVYMLKRSYSAENNDPQAATQNAGANERFDDGLRQRHVGPTPPVTASPVVPQVRQNDMVPHAQQQQLPTTWTNQAGVDPMAQQMLWWQQTYAQHYWAQYMQQYGNGYYEASTATPAPTTTPPVQQVSMQPATDTSGNAAEQPPQQQEAQRRPPMAAVGGVAQDDDDQDGLRAARDWLDWLYMGSRLAILLGVMYYYSSLPRFMLVTLVVAGIYLYQKAIHQRRAVSGNNGEVNNNNNNGQNAENRLPGDPAALAGEDDADEPMPPAPVEEPVTNTTPPMVATPTALNVALNLLIGFFTSLIPEVPAPEALN